MGNWKMKMMMMMSRPRRTQQQGVSYVPGHLTKMTTETMMGTPMMELTETMAPPLMMVPETMATTVAAAMTMATAVRFL
jgi:hypothetical protein